jgi:hypothetical protein
MIEKRWYNINGRQVYRAVPPPCNARSDFPVPYMSFDRIEPVVSQADGKTYDSLSALRRTYKADGNPQGMNYIEVGNEDLTKFTPPKRDDAKAIEAIERAEADVLAGRAAPVMTEL